MNIKYFCTIVAINTITCTVNASLPEVTKDPFANPDTALPVFAPKALQGIAPPACNLDNLMLDLKRPSRTSSPQSKEASPRIIDSGNNSAFYAPTLLQRMGERLLTTRSNNFVPKKPR